MKKWLGIFFASLGAFCLLIAAFNAAVDPFGVFGDRFLNYYEYNMTQNPRIAKIAYLDKNYEKYDSYIVGSSKTSSYPVELLNEYYGGASFYNMLSYGGDMYDNRKTIEYIVANYNVNNIILNIGLEEAFQYNYEDDKTKGNLHPKVEGKNPIPFYLKYAFLNLQYSFDKLQAYFERDYLPTANEVFIPQTGAYNKIVRDTEILMTEEEHIEAEDGFFLYREERDTLPYVDEVVEDLQAIKDLCEGNKINFMLIASPNFKTEIEDYNADELCYYWKQLADVTPFYDFAGYTPVSFESRYFYDDAHFRNDVGAMALAYIFGNGDVYHPEGFGHYTTQENVKAHAKNIFKNNINNDDRARYVKNIPILMYHDVSYKENNDMTVSPELFEEHIKALSENGYTPLCFDDMYAYVMNNAQLPEKCVMITFDDGYLSNYEYAYPILEKYGMKGAVFAVGVTMGQTTYKDTGKEINPHYTFEQGREMFERDVLITQSHTYDLHRVEGLDKEYRNGASKLPGESESEFAKMFLDDITKSKQEIETGVGNGVIALSYPQGIHSPVTDAVVGKAGYHITVTVEDGMSQLVRGVKQSLYGLKRFGMYQSITAEDLINKIQ